MKRGFYAAGLLAVCALAVPANADTFKCGNDTDAPNARWHVQVSHTREAGEGRKPGFFLLHNAKQDGAIVRTDDRRRIKLGGAGQPGTSYTVKLNATEKKDLEALADQRLNLKGATRVSVWVDFELNENMKAKDKRSGAVSVTDEDGEEIYSTAVTCAYSPAPVK